MVNAYHQVPFCPFISTSFKFGVYNVIPQKDRSSTIDASLTVGIAAQETKQNKRLTLQYPEFLNFGVEPLKNCQACT